jgi:predicted secreted protein
MLRSSALACLATVLLAAAAPTLASSAALERPQAGSPAAAPARASAPVLHLQARVSQRVPNDEMHVVLSASRDGAHVGALNAAVLGEVNEALAQARRVQGVQAALGSVSTQPQWGQAGRQTGWRVRAELRLHGRDFAALGALAGQLSERLQLSGVHFTVSDSARRTAEQALITRAAQEFGRKAQLTATALGFSTYAVAEVHLRPEQGVAPHVVQRASPMALRAEAAPVPDEGGESEVSLLLSGRVELRR